MLNRQTFSKKIKRNKSTLAFRPVNDRPSSGRRTRLSCINRFPKTKCNKQYLHSNQDNMPEAHPSLQVTQRSQNANVAGNEPVLQEVLNFNPVEWKRLLRQTIFYNIMTFQVIKLASRCVQNHLLAARYLFLFGFVECFMFNFHWASVSSRKSHHGDQWPEPHMVGHVFQAG